MNRVSHTGIRHPKPKNNFDQSLKLKAEVDQYLDGKIQEWKASVPFADQLEQPKVHQDWYIRHMIEHVWRIRLMRCAQVRALHAVSKVSPEAAQLYARYQDEEMLHDNLFSGDLEKHGVRIETVFQTEPFLATRLLAGFLYFISEHENPIGAICYSYLVEYTTQKITPKQLDAMKNSIGEDRIEGQVSHMNTDTVEDHTGDMWRLLNSLIFNEEHEQMLFKYLDEVQYLLGLYFKELHSTTVEQKPRLAQ